MKSYSKTFTYALFDKEFHIANVVSAVNTSKTVLSKDALQLHLINIEKVINIPTKKSVLADYNAGFLVPYILEKEIEFPATIPILLVKTKDSSQYQAIINLTSYCTVERDQFGTIVETKLDDKKLFNLLQTAWFYRKWAINDTKVTSNNAFIKVCANMYANLMYKVFDKEYAVGASFESIDRVKVALAYFFASYFVDSKYARDIAVNIPAIVDKRNAADYMSTIKVEAFEGFESLATLLRETIRPLAKLDTMYFVSKFSQIYNGPSVPAIDYLPYFVHMIGSAYIGSGFMKDILVNSIIRTDAEEFEQLLLNIYGK